jgi:hypothetical protein
MPSLALLAGCGGPEGGMWFYIVHLAQCLRILIEFTDWLECLNIDIIRFNGFALSEVPNFLHFLLI